MHVAYLIPTIDRIGGAEQQVISLARGLTLRGWKVSVIALSGSGGDAVSKLTAMGIGFRSLRMRKGLADPRGWIRLHSWMTKNRPDVVHAHLPHAALMARWSRLGSPVRALIDTIHSPATGRPVRKLCYRVTAAIPNLVTAVSNTVAESWLTSGALNDTNLAVIPNGVDASQWKPDDNIRTAMRRDLHLSDKFLWLAVGRLDPVKDHATLLRAFSRLSTDARLVIAGTGPLQNQLNLLANELGIGDRVQFLGFEPHVVRWMRAADGFVLSSHCEGLPLALIEACASELPSVITGIAGALEVLPDPLRTSSVPVQDADALAEAMNCVMRMPASERRDRGRFARESIAERFSLDAVLDQWEALYSEGLQRNPQPSRLGKSWLPLGRTFQLQ